MNNQYILDANEQPQVCDDVITWGRWMETAKNRVVSKTKLPDGVYVSTVFLGLDHAFTDAREPILYETMIFGGPHDQYQERYSTRQAALVGHTHAVRIALGVLEEAPTPTVPDA